MYLAAVAQYMILMLQTICAHPALLGGQRYLYNYPVKAQNVLRGFTLKKLRISPKCIYEC
jgi:hypothetical protein